MPRSPHDIFGRIAEDVQKDPEMAALYLTRYLESGDRETFVDVFEVMMQGQKTAAWDIVPLDTRKTGAQIFDVLSGRSDPALKEVCKLLGQSGMALALVAQPKPPEPYRLPVPKRKPS